MEQSVTVPTKRILLSAYSCEPDKGSEPGVGWNTALQLARRHEVWVITRANNRRRIEEALADSPQANLAFLYCDLPAWARWWKKGGRGVQLYYLLWQVAAYRLAKRAHTSVGFHVVHHVTFGKYWGPTLMPGLGIPFLWGPIGGGESCPPVFWTGGGIRPVAFEGIRSVARWIGERNLFVRRAARQAQAILVPTPDTERRLLRLGARNIVRFPGQTGISADEIQRLASLPDPVGSTCRFLTIGRLEHWKGVHLAIRAFAHADLTESSYAIVGDGPQRESLEGLVATLGVSDQVQILGELPRSRTFDQLGKSHVLVHPSLHDFFPTVCLEGMAAGRPVICLDIGGPAVQVDDATGIRIPADSPDQVIRDLSGAMKQLASNPKLRDTMGGAGQTRVGRYFVWEQQAVALYDIYDGIQNQ